ncbi:MAG: SDR family oxidoreductase [Candidatus Omnitrophica bacterium]|nr:SDR family oxidoreductase [Candidatus Omnitrophota bacterium]
MSLYLVTGGAGFIGSNIVEELVKRGEGVRVLDNFLTGKKENLEPFKDKIEIIEGDIRSADDASKSLKDVDYVIHQAALRSVPKSVDDPFLTNDVNVTGTLNLLYEAKKANVKRLVYASSSSCYGDVISFPQKEDFNPRPISPYGVSKLAAENYCNTFSATFGLETVSLRYFNVFGPRQNPESKYSAAIPAILSRMLNDKSPIVEWDGKQSRDFTYVYNVVEANLKSAVTEGVSGEVFNVACGNSVSILDIVNMINKTISKDLEPEFAPKRAGDVRKSYADISKMNDMLQLKPKFDFEKGLKQTVEWFMENKEGLLKI